MKKTILLGIFALAFAFNSTVKAEMSLSGYAEFFAGSADQPTANGTTNHGIDKAGMDNGTYTRLTANYSSTMDNGIDVNGTVLSMVVEIGGGIFEFAFIEYFNYFLIGFILVITIYTVYKDPMNLREDKKND